MADLFGRQDQILRGGLASDAMFMSFPQLTSYGLGLLIQQIGLQYRQPIRRIFEIGPGVVPFAGGLVSAGECDFPTSSTPTALLAACNNRMQATYYIVGRPEGRLNLQRFVGPQALTCEFYRRYGSPCSGNLVQLSGKAGCSATDGSARQLYWDLNGVVLDDYNATATGQEMVMQEGIGAMFTSLKVTAVGDVSCV